MSPMARPKPPMKFANLALLAAATFAATIALAATTHADPDGFGERFQSPSGNIVCILDGNSVACQIKQHTYAPPPPGNCPLGGWSTTFALDPGQPPHHLCQGGMIADGPMPTLDYGQTRSAGPLTCDSEPSGVTCTDSSTGHFFRVSRESYQLG
jgi:hypothetical protein